MSNDFVAISPAELTFLGPFRQPVSAQITLANLIREKTVFRIKSSTPNIYFSDGEQEGVLEAMETKTVKAWLEPQMYGTCQYKVYVDVAYDYNGIEVMQSKILNCILKTVIDDVPANLQLRRTPSITALGQDGGEPAPGSSG